MCRFAEYVWEDDETIDLNASPRAQHQENHPASQPATQPVLNADRLAMHCHTKQSRAPGDEATSVSEADKRIIESEHSKVESGDKAGGIILQNMNVSTPLADPAGEQLDLPANTSDANGFCLEAGHQGASSGSPSDPQQEGAFLARVFATLQKAVKCTSGCDTLDMISIHTQDKHLEEWGRDSSWQDIAERYYKHILCFPCYCCFLVRTSGPVHCMEVISVEDLSCNVYPQ